MSNNPEVIAEFICPMMEDKFPSGIYHQIITFKIIQGYPLVGHNGYLDGKIDTIVESHIELTQGSSSRGTLNIVLKDVVALIIDAKPKLNNISSTLDQINAYVRLLDFDSNYKNLEKKMKVIITFDRNGRFDSMFRGSMSIMFIRMMRKDVIDVGHITTNHHYVMNVTNG